jgi:hypothetical protein
MKGPQLRLCMDSGNTKRQGRTNEATRGNEEGGRKASDGRRTHLLRKY